MAISSELTFMSAAELKQQGLEDVTLQALDNGVENPPVEPGGEWDLLFTGLANIASVLIANQQILDEDANPLRATGAALDEWRQWLQLPEVGASPAAGPVAITVIGTGTIPTDQAFVAPNGFTARVIAGVSDVTGVVTVDAEMTTTGSAGNLPAGTQVRLVGGPPNLQVLATIPTDWVGGNEVENDQRKRERVLSRLQSANAGWGALRDKTLESTGAISDAFIYWALGGPGSVKVVVTSGTSAKTRVVPAATLLAISSYLATPYPVGTWKLVVQSALDHPVDVELAIALPLTGSHRWIAGGPIARTVVATAASETSFAVTSAATLGALAPGETIACWDPVELTAATAKVLSISGTAITTTVWSGGEGPAVGSWIFPACDDLQGIVANWLDIMLSMGPAENVATSDPRYTFSARLPAKSSSKPMQLTNVQLIRLMQLIPEASDLSYFSTPTVAPVPALAGDAPYVVTLRNFAIYPL